MDRCWKSTFILIASSFHLAASAGVGGQCTGTEAQCVKHRESALLQTTRSVQRRMTQIVSGSTITLRVQRTGKRITAEMGGLVHAKWDHTGEWERFYIEKAEAPLGDNVTGGDTILLRAWTGNRLTAQEDAVVHAQWNHTGVWERFVVEKLHGQGPIVDGDTIFLRSWTGKYIDADPPFSPPGKVEARFTDMGEWQKLVVEEVRTPTPAPTPVPVPVPTPAPTLATPTGRQVVSDREWKHFSLLNDLRSDGCTCGTEAYAPNNVPLVFNCRLWRASYLHSEDMVEQGYFSHYSPDGRSPWDRAAAQNTSATAENIAAGRTGAAATLEQWENSVGHCQNMMNPNRKAMAVGHAEGGTYSHYWTQMFSDSDGDSIDDTTCYPVAFAQVQPHGMSEALVATEVPEKGAVLANEIIGDPWP